MNLLHNMSAPPRTSFTLCGRPVAGSLRIVSFVWALAQKIHATPPPPRNSTKRGKATNGSKSTAWNWQRDGIPEIGHALPETLPKLSQKLRDLFENPADLFSKIGQPIAPAWSVDFLIGYRLRYEDIEDPNPDNKDREAHPLLFCTDPLLCAGILSRCAGALFLSRRTPNLSWETLLDLPIAFDDPLASIR